MVKASIRSNNPGAMWGKNNKIAAKWGSTRTEGLNDGLGQGNNIAYFPTPLAGACAQFDLWRVGYCNMTLKAAISKWSGGNWDQPYADFLCRKTGLTLDTMVTAAMLAGPTGIALMKAQAQWEAGQPYPGLSDADWALAQRKVFATRVTPTTKKVVVGSSCAGATVTAAQQAHASGTPWWGVLIIVVGGLLLTAGLVWIIHKRNS